MNSPPHFQKGVLYSRLYQIPKEFLNFKGPNTLSIWIYNDARPGGITQGKPIIGDYYKLLQKNTFVNYQTLIFITVLLIFTLFHFIYFYFHRHSKDYLLFALFTFAWAAYLYTFGELGLSSGLNLNTLFRINVSLFFVSFCLFPLFIYAFFDQKPDTYVKTILYISVSMIPLCFLLPDPGMLYWPLEFIEILTIPMLVLVARFLYQCLAEKRPYAKSFIVATLFYILFGSLDIIIDITHVDILNSMWLFGPWALVFFSFILTVLIAHKNFSYYQESIIDGLTSTLRRDEFIVRLNKEIKRAARESNFILVVMIDLDDFKLINDKYGHRRGDQVLIQVTSALKSELRLFDHIGRYGGDEFCISASFSHREEIEGFVNRIHNKVSSLSFEVKDKEECISVTFGAVIHQPDDSKTANQLLQAADQLLISAKQDQKGKIFW